MDPATIVVVGLIGYVLLKQNASGQTALAQALQNITGGSGGSKPGSAPGSGSGSPSAAAAQAAKAAAASGGQTPQSLIDSLASDGNSGDAQVAAYLQALNDGNTQLADAIIGDDAQINLESDPDPTVDDSTIATTDTPVYEIPTVTYDGGDDGGDSGDYGDDGGDD